LVDSFKSTLDEVREADLLLHVVDISHPDFEDHIESVNQTLADIKSNDKPIIMVFNKIDAYKHLTIEEDDLITEKTKKHYTLEEWKHTWMNNVGQENTLFISATNKENFEEFRARVYESVRQIHITRFPYNKFLYPDYQDAIEKETEEIEEEN
jgi:GTP-binding protein HflX